MRILPFDHIVKCHVQRSSAPRQSFCFGAPESLGEGYPCTNSCGAGVSECIEGAVVCVNPDGESCGTTDPDAGTDGGGGGVFGGCSCRTPGGPGSLPLIGLLVLLVLLGRRRRSR